MQTYGMPLYSWGELLLRWGGFDYEVRQNDDMQLFICGPKIINSEERNEEEHVRYFCCGGAGSSLSMKLRAMMTPIDTEDKAIVDATVVEFLDNYVLIEEETEEEEEETEEEEEETEEEEEEEETEEEDGVKTEKLLAQFNNQSLSHLEEVASDLERLAENAIMGGFTWSKQKERNWSEIYHMIRSKAEEIKKVVAIRKKRGET